MIVFQYPVRPASMPYDEVDVSRARIKPVNKQVTFYHYLGPGVYILPFISIFILIKKMPFLADFIKNWAHFIKNSDFLLKNDQI